MDADLRSRQPPRDLLRRNGRLKPYLLAESQLDHLLLDRLNVRLICTSQEHEAGCQLGSPQTINCINQSQGVVVPARTSEVDEVYVLLVGGRDRNRVCAVEHDMDFSGRKPVFMDE